MARGAYIQRGGAGITQRHRQGAAGCADQLVAKIQAGWRQAHPGRADDSKNSLAITAAARMMVLGGVEHNVTIAAGMGRRQR